MAFGRSTLCSFLQSYLVEVTQWDPVTRTIAFTSLVFWTVAIIVTGLQTISAQALLASIDDTLCRLLARS